MSRNVEVLRRTYDAMTRGNFWEAREMFDPEIEWEWASELSGLAGAGKHRGLEGVEAATRDWLSAWDWFWQEAEDFIEVDDRVVVLTFQHGRPKGSTAAIEARRADVWTMRDGKAVDFKAYSDRADALRAVGLAE
jgi:ketosteroid isomerase-like protein